MKEQDCKEQNREQSNPRREREQSSCPRREKERSGCSRRENEELHDVLIAISVVAKRLASRIKTTKEEP